MSAVCTASNPDWSEAGPTTAGIPDHTAEEPTWDLHPADDVDELAELACELLRARAALDDATATFEVTRYFGWPGPAISYEVGEQVILDLRYRRAARPDFDLKCFHADVPAVGMVGLDFLQRRVVG